MKRTPQIPRTRQVGVNITEEMLEKLKKVAAMDGTTYSHKAYQILQYYLEERQADIDAYDKFVVNLKGVSKS